MSSTSTDAPAGLAADRAAERRTAHRPTPLLRAAYALLERGLLPDPVIRFGIRRMLAERLRAEDPGSEEARERRLEQLAAELRRSPIALHPERANEQHYELPTEFFRLVLGPALKYSGSCWPPGVTTLEAAERAMLELTAERAEIADGQEILDLGCGWGSLALHLAERYPRSRILAVSNSRTQGDFIRAEAERRGLDGIEAVTAEVSGFTTERRFDRVVSVEMFEHMRNYERLLGRIAAWMRPGGKLFVHVFCHRELAYPFEDRGPSDWMARHFFTGGLMPSADLLPRFQGAVELEEKWLVDGTHYQKTSEAWLANMDRRRRQILPIFERVYGRAGRRRWWICWRVFFMSCAELFGYRGGGEWMVAHYRFRRPTL